MGRGLVRLGAVLATATAVLAVWGVPASAHVTVNPGSATQGGYTKVAFRVPNERPDASTVKLEVVIPAEAPIASVSIKPTPGWAAVAEKTTLATPVEMHGRQISEVTSRITWTAGAGAEIKPGEFQEFEVSLGPLPEVDQIIFKALQTYSSGEIVRWIDEPNATTEPEHPAPVLKLTMATTEAAVVQPASQETSSTASTVIAVVALVMALVGAVLALLALRRPGKGA